MKTLLIIISLNLLQAEDNILSLPDNIYESISLSLPSNSTPQEQWVFYLKHKEQLDSLQYEQVITFK